MSLEDWQIKHNKNLDEEIRKADREYDEYVADMARQKEEFIKRHPDHPYKDLMFLVVIGKRHVGGIRYIE